MPVSVKKMGDKFRVVESRTGKVATGQKGTSVDGGGHASHADALAQVNAINISERRRAGKSAPPKPRS